MHSPNGTTKVIFAYISLWLTLGFLFYSSISLIQQHSFFAKILMFQLLNSFFCHFLFGIGTGLMMVLLATFLGWIQLWLVAQGKINPHLAKEGLFTVLNTLLSKI